MLDFPASPVNGQLFQGANGVIYQWNAAGGLWLNYGVGMNNAIISSAPPANPVAGQLWWSPDLGQMFIYYNDGSSSQWVQTSPTVAGGAIPVPAARFGRASGYASGNTGGNWLTIALDTVVFNDGAGAFAGNIWTPGAGTWHFDAALYLIAPAGSQQQQLGLGVAVNGTTPIVPIYSFCYPGQVMCPVVSIPVKLVAGDTVRLVYNIVGSDPGNYQIGGSNFTFLSGYRINP